MGDRDPLFRRYRSRAELCAARERLLVLLRAGHRRMDAYARADVTSTQVTAWRRASAAFDQAFLAALTVGTVQRMAETAGSAALPPWAPRFLELLATPRTIDAIAAELGRTRQSLYQTRARVRALDVAWAAVRPTGVRGRRRV